MLKTLKSIESLTTLRRARRTKHNGLGHNDQEVELLVLSAVASVTDLNLKAHVPLQAILCKFKREHRGFVKKAMKRLAKTGYISSHPTRGELTWQLTRMGVGIIVNKNKAAR
jgi:hypothetical protein